MKRIEDERIRFYLKNRQQIEEWAKVGTKALPQFAHEFYASLESGLRDQAQNCETFAGINVECNDLNSNYPYISIRRPCWPQVNEAPFVCLAWRRNVNVQADFSQNQELLCGISAKVKVGNLYRETLHRQQMDDYPEKPTEWWPKSRRVDPPVGNFWEGNNLEEYGHYVIKTVLKAWSDLAPLVDEAVKSHNQ